MKRNRSYDTEELPAKFDKKKNKQMLTNDCKTS